MSKRPDPIDSSAAGECPDMSMAPPPLSDSDIIGLGKYKYMPLPDVPVSFYEWMVKEQIEAPRVYRGVRWIQVMDWLRSKRETGAKD